MRSSRGEIPLNARQLPVVWALASTTFACLLGHLYGFWSMRLFACLVLPPAAALLTYIAWAARGQASGVSSPHTWIVTGALGGVFAAVVYDLFRLPFVLAGYPLFGVFPRFGQMLLYGALNDETGPAVQAAGWLYHFANGASLGIMFLAMVPRATWRALFWGAVAWAATVEVLLLLTPYYAFFQLHLPFPVFLALTLSAHLVFGAALGGWCWRRLQPGPAMESAA